MQAWWTVALVSLRPRLDDEAINGGEDDQLSNESRHLAARLCDRGSMAGNKYNREGQGYAVEVVAFGDRSASPDE